MADAQDRRAPYASTGSIKTVIEKHRQVGLQSMNLQRLQQIGVTEALAPRTLHALTFLGFYDEQGRVTPEFDALRKVPEHDFKPRLAALLREAYAPILEILDPATATPLDVENAFRRFKPTGQLPRMVQLFIGLMAYAEVMPEPQRRGGGGGSSQTASKTSAKGSATRGSPRTPDGKAGPERPHQPSPPSQPTGVERRVIRLGEAGTVTIAVDVRWLDLPDHQFTKLRQLIKDIEALEHAGNDVGEVSH